MGGALKWAPTHARTSSLHTRTMEDAEEERNPRKCTRRSLCSWGPGWKTLTWFIVLAVYLLLGGLVFTLAERPNEEESVAQAAAQREELRRLLDEARDNVIAELTARNETLTESEAEELTGRLANVSASLALASQELPAESSPLWTYSSSITFCATVVTTIGYGNTAPVTAAGRTLFVFYALIGIPICLVFLSHLGVLLSMYIDYITDRVARKTKTKPARHQKRILELVSLSLFILGLLFFVFIPSIIFSSIEGWTYGESVYYCFVTLTTVGFGDFVPGRTTSSEIYAFYRTCAGAWVIVGLAWVALLITRTQTFLGSTGVLIATKLRERRKRRKKDEDLNAEELETPVTSFDP